MEKEKHGNARLEADICPGFVTRDDAVAYLCGSPGLRSGFEQLPEEMQREMIGYCVGENGLAVTRDYVFKKIFDPECHKDRLESLLTALLETNVKIVDILQTGGLKMAEKGSFVIMDVLTELESIGYADLEMQKVGYQFPLERSDCYGADIIMRQYNRIRSKMKEEKKEGQPFDFRRLKPVFCIVLTEDSWSEFHKWPEHYIHRRYMTFDTGIMKENKGLREDVFVCLDLFRKNLPNICEDMNRLDRWLTFLSETNADRILKLLEVFPEYREMYGEIAEFVRKPEELMEMYSEILRILDRNSERNMVTDLQGEVDELKGEVDELKGENKELKGENKELKDTIAEYKVHLIKQIQTKMNKGKTLSEIACELETEENKISCLYKQILEKGTDCDAEEIFKSIGGCIE